MRQAPREGTRHATLGMVYAANGLWAEAKLAFENTILLSPKEPLAYLYLAISHQELGQSDRALQLLRELTGRFPTFAPGFFRLGDYSLRAGYLDESQAAFQRLIDLQPREWRGFAGVGEVQLRKGNAEHAARLLEQGVRLDPSAKSIHALLGQAYQRLGRTNEAERELRMGMNAMQYALPDAWSVQAPEHMRLFVDLMDMAQEHILNGAPDKAVPILEMALPFHSDNQVLLVALALADTFSGQPQKAHPLLDRALQLNPASVPAFIALSGCELALGRREEALSNADRAIQFSTNHAEAFVARANALLAVDRDAEAVEALQNAHRCDPTNPQILLDLGDLLLRNLKQPQAALEQYRKATALAPLLPQPHVRLANLYIQLGNRKEAVASLQLARELAPEDPVILKALARLNAPAPP